MPRVLPPWWAGTLRSGTSQGKSGTPDTTKKWDPFGGPGLFNICVTRVCDKNTTRRVVKSRPQPPAQRAAGGMPAAGAPRGCPPQAKEKNRNRFPTPRSAPKIGPPWGARPSGGGLLGPSQKSGTPTRKIWDPQRGPGTPVPPTMAHTYMHKKTTTTTTNTN